jgi:hypothetical protein
MPVAPRQRRGGVPDEGAEEPADRVGELDRQVLGTLAERGDPLQELAVLGGRA